MPTGDRIANEAETAGDARTEHRILHFAYINWRGERGYRTVFVLGMRWGSTEWHPEPQWLLTAYDFDRRAVREFAVKDMAPMPNAG